MAMTILETFGVSDPLKNQDYARAIYNLAYKFLPHFYSNTQGLVKEFSQTKTIRLLFKICAHPTRIYKDLNPPRKLVEMVNSSTHRFSDSRHAVIITWPPFGAIGTTLAPFFSALNYDPKSYSETQLFHLGPSPQGGNTLRFLIRGAHAHMATVDLVANPMNKRL
jgi:hypothetical protein